MSSLLEEAKSAIGVDNQFAFNRIIEVLTQENENQETFAQCHLILTPLLFENKENRALTNSLMTIFAAVHNKILSEEEVRNLFKKLNSENEIEKNSPTWIRMKVVELIIYFFEFSDIENSKIILFSLKEVFKSPLLVECGDERDIYKCYISVLLCIADIDENDDEIEKISTKLFPSVFPFNKQVVEAFEYGKGLNHFKRKRYKEATKIFFKLTKETSKEKRKEKCIKYGSVSCLISSSDYDFGIYVSGNHFLESLWSSFQKNGEIPKLPEEESDERFKEAFNTLIEKTNERRMKEKVSLALKPYSRVKISYVSKESGISAEEIIKNAFHAGFFVDEENEEIISIGSKKDDDLEGNIIDAVTNVARKVIAPKAKIRFTGVTVTSF